MQARLQANRILLSVR